MSKRAREQYEIPFATMDRILRQEGGYRVSEDAAMKLREVVEDLARDVARTSVEMCKHAGRRTVRAVDVEMALKVTLNRWVALLAVQQKV